MIKISETLESDYALLKNLTEHFNGLDYQSKVELYHQKFNIIPFEFPAHDVEISWFNNQMKLDYLTTVFHQERRGINLYVKEFNIDGQSFNFNIKPQTFHQRIFLNQFILSKFLEKKTILHESFFKEVELLDNPVEYLENKISHLTMIVNWCKDSLELPDSSLRVKFLRIFFNGYQAFYTGSDKMIGIRRKYIELFLYSQGLILAEYFELLKSYLQAITKGINKKKSLSIPLKVLLLHELGIIDLLRNKYSVNKTNNSDNIIAEIVCLITSEKLSNLNIVLKYISTLGTGTTSYLLNKSNIKIIKEELAKISP